MRRRILLALAFLLVALPAPAGAAVIQDFSSFTSATNGIALGPDGNFWVAEENSATVARMTPAGDIIGRYNVGTGPTSVAAGPGGTVWVAVTGASRLVRITISTGAVDPYPMLPGCGPVAVADGGNGRMYFSQPGDCGGQSYVGSMTTSGADTVRTPTDRVYDLIVTGGKVFAAEYGGDRILRFGLALGAAETAVGVPGGSSPDGITVDGAGNIWVTLNGTGGVARFPSGQSAGNATTFSPPAGSPLTEPFGIAATAAGVYVAAKNTLARVSSTGTYKFFATGGGEPFDIVPGVDGDVYFTDRASTRVRRLISSAPRISASGGAATATTSANVSATVDARGNATTVTFEYGPTTAYGSAVTVPANGAAPFPVGATLTGLAPGTTYHFRVRAINEEGEATPGGDLTFATPAAPVPTPTLKARANFSWGYSGSRTALTRIRVSDLSGGETIKITCSGGKAKGCPLKSKTYKNVKKGTRTLTALFGRKKLLRTGAKIVVTISKPGAIGSTATLTIGKRKKDPKIVRKTA